MSPERGWALAMLTGAAFWLVVAWGVFGCAYAHGPQGTTFAIGDAVAKSTARTCSADGGTISDNARLMIAQAVAAGVKAAVGGGIPSIEGLLPATAPATPPDAVLDPVVVAPLAPASPPDAVLSPVVVPKLGESDLRVLDAGP